MDNDGFRRLNAVYWQSYNNGYIDLNRIACYNSINQSANYLLYKIDMAVVMEGILLAFITCHDRKQKADIYKITPTRQGIFEEIVLHLPECSFCKNTILVIRRIDIFGNVLPASRMTGKKAKKFLSEMNIIWKPKTIHTPSYKGNWYLPYSEYGSIKKCYSNLSALKIGLF